MLETKKKLQKAINKNICLQLLIYVLKLSCLLAYDLFYQSTKSDDEKHPLFILILDGLWLGILHTFILLELVTLLFLLVILIINKPK